jgi:lipopolysaccharide heptosyltransferase III
MKRGLIPNNLVPPGGTARAHAATLLPSLPAESRVLLIRLRSIGDIVLLTPALRLLKAWRPDLRVSVLVEARFSDLLRGLPEVDEVLELRRGEGGHAEPFRLIRAVRQRRFALCLNLHGGPTSAWLTALSGARWKAGFAHFRQRRLYNVLLPDNAQLTGRAEIHTAELQAAVLFWLGMPAAEIPAARVEVASEHREWWRRRRAELEIGTAYAVIQPTALYATKQWAAEKFAALGARIESELRLPVLYTCGPGEASVLADVERASQRPVRRLEGAGLGRFAAAVAESELFLGNDSGPAHMACALGRPVVVIFGSSNSRIWGPWPPAARGEARPSRVVQNRYACNPCPGDRCYQFAKPECILSVSAGQVWEAVEAVVAESRVPR